MPRTINIAILRDEPKKYFRIDVIKKFFIYDAILTENKKAKSPSQNKENTSDVKAQKVTSMYYRMMPDRDFEFATYEKSTRKNRITDFITRATRT